MSWNLYKDDPIRVLYIWEGGLAIYCADDAAVAEVQAQAQAVLCEYAQRSVLGDMIAGKILGQEPAFREASGLFWMDMTCACQEMIARQRPAELFEGEDTND